MKYTIEWKDDKRNKGTFKDIEASSKEEAVKKVKSYMITDTAIKYTAYKENK